jgi:hypothetical protein
MAMPAMARPDLPWNCFHAIIANDFSVKGVSSQ